MAYVLHTPEGGGISVGQTARMWFHGVTDDNHIRLSVATDLDVEVKLNNRFMAEEEPRKLVLDRDTRVRLVRSGEVHVEFAIDLMDNLYSKFVFFQTAPANKRAYTHVIKGRGKK